LSTARNASRSVPSTSRKVMVSMKAMPQLRGPPTP
jgi:hypothetical protein